MRFFLPKAMHTLRAAGIKTASDRVTHPDEEEVSKREARTGYKKYSRVGTVCATNAAHNAKFNSIHSNLSTLDRPYLTVLVGEVF